MADIQVHEDTKALAQAAADRFVAASEDAIEKRGRFTVALSGGSTPQETYSRLADPSLATRVSWRNVLLFWGDERCVPPDHPDSNYRMVRKTLIQKVPIPQTNVHRILGELDPDLAAEAYVDELRSVFGSEERPRFDLIFLGLGEDGHTASLFPGSLALSETEHWVLAVFAEQLQTWRVTLTPPVFNSARQLLFLVAGKSKADRLQEVLEGEPQPESLPAQIIQPRNGQVTWLIDQAAAAKL
ncbi:MAG: 6-phosphogluconolactonase [Anaerolineales bacterium]